MSKRRILYGVHGYGRGHSARALAILPELRDRYDVRILAGDDAYDQLSREYDVTRIPCIRYFTGKDNKRSAWRTIIRNAPAFFDRWWNGPISHMVEDEIRRFAPDIILSDSEGWTHRAGARLGVPRISFDHYGILAVCDLPVKMSRWDRIVCRLESSLFYRDLIHKPDRMIVAAFYPGQARQPGVTVVGPILRRIVRETEPTDGEHLLTYFTNAQEHFTPAVERALASLDVPVRIYGPNRDETRGNLIFRPTGNEPFVRDLASCRGVFSTSGNQLISEAIHFGKPILTVPEEALEQRLNAAFVQQWGIGRWIRRNQITHQTLVEFLHRTPEYAARIPRYRRDGLGEALAAIHAGVQDLAGASS